VNNNLEHHKILRGLKVTFIGQASLDDTHGGATRLKTMINLLNGLGIAVDLISYSFYSDKFSIEQKRLNPLLQSTTVCVPDNLPKFLKAFSVIPFFLCAWKSTKNCDFLFTNFRFILSSIPATILSKIFNKPVISDYLDVDPKVPDIIYNYNAKNADAVFAITHQLIDKVKRYGGKNAVYAPNFVDTNRFKVDIRTREKMREELGIEKDEIVIGYAGAFTYWEGVPILLQAFKNLTKKYSKIKLAVMGKIYSLKKDDNIPKLVEDMNLKNDVILIPPQPHEDVPKFLSAFDILCCPKIDCEINRLITPIKIIEYLSMGLPTVCSAVGGIPDTIEDGVDGLLVKPGDVKNLEEKLEWIIQNPELSGEIGENGRKNAIEKYSYEAIEDTIRQAINEIVDRKKGNKVGD
jgi:glycosyltransferase involved in cell wall biosynthesis